MLLGRMDWCAVIDMLLISLVMTLLLYVPSTQVWAQIAIVHVIPMPFSVSKVHSNC